MNHLTGRQFGQLTALRKTDIRESAHIVWFCQCSCGNTCSVASDKLLNGNNRSCGCLRAAMIRSHGGSTAGNRDKEYNQWCSMKGRCKPNTRAAHRYFDRGIRVCERWEDYANFLADMGRCPPGMSIDRIDNNRGYQPGNCRWATRTQQAQNMSTNNLITHDGKTLCLTEWSRITDIPPTTIWHRLAIGWPVDKCLTVPPLKRRPRLHRITRS